MKSRFDLVAARDMTPLSQSDVSPTQTPQSLMYQQYLSTHSMWIVMIPHICIRLSIVVIKKAGLVVLWRGTLRMTETVHTHAEVLLLWKSIIVPHAGVIGIWLW